MFGSKPSSDINELIIGVLFVGAFPLCHGES